MSDTNQPRKTRLKGDANSRPCFDCGVTKDRFKDFKPRQSRCAKHRIKGTKSDPTCDGCVKLVNGNVRQPRCTDCDSKRSGKRSKNKVVTPVAAPAPVAPTPVVAAPVATVVEASVVVPVATVETQVEATPAVAPAAEVAPTPTPAPTVEPVVVAQVKPKKTSHSKADLAKLFTLLDEPEASASDEGNNAPL